MFDLRKPLVRVLPWHAENPLASRDAAGSPHRMRTGPRRSSTIKPKLPARSSYRAWIVSIWRSIATMLVRLGRRHHENHRLFGRRMRASMLADASHAQNAPAGRLERPRPDKSASSCPTLAGGPTDVMARLVAQHLTEGLGQNFFVENLTGERRGRHRHGGEFPRRRAHHPVRDQRLRRRAHRVEQGALRCGEKLRPRDHRRLLRRKWSWCTLRFRPRPCGSSSRSPKPVRATATTPRSASASGSCPANACFASALGSTSCGSRSRAHRR